MAESNSNSYTIETEATKETTTPTEEETTDDFTEIENEIKIVQVTTIKERKEMGAPMAVEEIEPSSDSEENEIADINTAVEKNGEETAAVAEPTTEEATASTLVPVTTAETVNVNGNSKINPNSIPIPVPIPNPNLDLVDEKLYLGNLKAACDVPLLKKYDIKYILTVDSYPLPPSITDLPFLKAKYIQVCDIPKEDILNYFQDSFNFIENAISSSSPRGGNLLVHCNVGVSRSATIVLAYMMRKYRLTLEEAQEKLISRRSVIGPNKGFLAQLKLYEKMNYAIDPHNEFYRKFRLSVAADKIKCSKILAPPYTDVIRKDPGVCTVRPEPVVYQCRKCRRILASASNLITHREKHSSHWFDFDLVQQQKSTTAAPTAPATIEADLENKGKICTQMIFVEPISWMANVTLSPNGKLHCPNANCKSKLGSFSWVMHCVCPCGAKIQPAFYLVPSKVDRSTSVLNLQITI